MVTLSYDATIATDPGVISTGIKDFILGEGASGLTLYSATGPDGGFAAFRIGAGGVVSQLGDRAFPAGSQIPSSTRILAVDLPSGDEGLLALGRQGASTQVLTLASDGSLSSNWTDITPDLGLAGTPGLGASAGGTVALAEAGGTILRSYGFDASGDLIQRDQVDVLADTGLDREGGLSVLASVETTGGTYVLAGVSGADQVLSYHMAAGGDLTLVDQIGMSTGLGIADPTAISTVAFEGKTYAVIASAGSSSLTVAEIGADGHLTATDHVLDNLATRFQSVLSVSTAVADGHAYVLAGGGDDGISLFTLTPGGRLAHLATLEDTDTRALDNVQAVELAAVGDVLNLFAASETEPGIAHLTLDAGALGVVTMGPAGTATVTGGSGADILIAGSGGNTLEGGAGADLFVFRPENADDDGALGRVADYQKGVDKLDLSALPLFHGAGQLQVSSTTTGALLDYNGYTIEVTSADGSSLEAKDFTDADVVNLDRVFLGNASGEAVALPTPATEEGTGPETSGPVTGTTTPDLLTAPDGGVEMQGLGGNDTLIGGAGDDTLDGGAGADALDGGEGIDWASYASAGAGVHADMLIRALNTGDASGDSYSAIEGMLGSSFADELFASNGDNLIDGGAGDDLIKGRGGDDVIAGGSGNDTLDGGAGADALDGGAGTDIASYATATARIIADLANSAANQGDAAGDNYTGIEGVQGSGHDDKILGADLADWLSGGDGNDGLYGRAGNDTLEGGAGNDTLEGGAGADHLVGGGGLSDVASYFGAAAGVRVNLTSPDQNTGDAAGDSYDGIEVLLGSNFADDLRGTAGTDTLVGREGDDFIMGFDDRDMLRGDGGNDTLDGGNGSDTLRGGDGHDVLYGGQGNDRILGEDGNDRIVATLGNNKLFAGAGADTVLDGPGASRLVGNAGNDFLVGGGGNDTLVGNSADDRLAGGDGRDKIVGGAGDDYMVGNAGNDWFVFNPGYGADTIGDFSLSQGDEFYVNRELAGGAAATVADVMAMAEVSDAGLVFEFADGTSALLAGIYSTEGLESQIVLFG